MAGGVMALGNIPVKTDANGYLLVTIGGGNWTPDTITLDSANKDTVMARATGGQLAFYATGIAGSANALLLMNGTTQAATEYGEMAWVSNFLNIGGVVNGGTARPVRIISPTVAVISPAGFDHFIFQTGGFSTYGGVAAKGKGVPAIYAAGSVAGTTGAIGALATYTVGATDGDFEVGGNIAVNTATTHNFTMACLYTDAAGTARTATLSFALVAGTITTAVTAANGTVPYMGLPQRIHAKKTTVITVFTTGTLTTVNYDATANIAQYQ